MSLWVTLLSNAHTTSPLHLTICELKLDIFAVVMRAVLVDNAAEVNNLQCRVFLLQIDGECCTVLAA